MVLGEKISKVYHPFLDQELLSIKVPQEHLADCNSCHLCANNRLSLYHTKCCTYHPILPNFMVGAILSDQLPSMDEGISRIRTAIQNKKGVNPVGILPSKEYKEKLKTHDTHKTMETANAAACPFLHKKSCSIWDYRTELCATYFCTSVAGSVGTTFWDALNTYLVSSDRALAYHCLSEMRYPNIQPVLQMFDNRRCTADMGVGGINHDVYNHLWQQWVGKEEDFYISCYEVLKRANPEELQQTIPLKTDAARDQMMGLAREFNSAVFPNKLRFKTNPSTKIETSGQYITIHDGAFKLKIAKIQFLFINMCDGHTSTFSIIKKARNIKIDIIGPLQKLIDMGLLSQVDN